MSSLKVLFIGGSGVISSACARRAVDDGIDLYVLNRGRSTARPLPAGVRELRADVRSPGSVRDAIEGLEFDSVVDWVTFTTGHVRGDIELFMDRTGQYVVIDWYLADASRQVTDKRLDALMDKLAADFAVV